MNFINSQYITSDMTHLTPEKGYLGMKKTGIKLPDMGDRGLLYKPPGFWISLDGDWEDWCTSEEFRNVDTETICNVYLKPNLTFIRISTVNDADELMSFLIPEIVKYQLLDFDCRPSDMMTLMQYQTQGFRDGIMITAKQLWRKALDSCDGIYYENSGSLHFNTIFNTWDCSSIMLFDPRNVSINKQ